MDKIETPQAIQPKKKLKIKTANILAIAGMLSILNS